MNLLSGLKGEGLRASCPGCGVRPNELHKAECPMLDFQVEDLTPAEVCPMLEFQVEDLTPTEVVQQQALVPVRALSDDEIAAFWPFSSQRRYTQAYLAAFCEKNGLVLLPPEE